MKNHFIGLVLILLSFSPTVFANTHEDVKVLLDFEEVDLGHEKTRHYLTEYSPKAVSGKRSALVQFGKYNNLITFIEHTTCMPYIKYNGVRYATFNMLKHLYHMGKELPELFRLTEQDPLDYECLLSELMEAKKRSKKKAKKFRSFISKCQGEEWDKRADTIMDRWSSKIRTLKKTKYYIDTPKKGYITTVVPMEKTDANLPYKPEETHYKKPIYTKTKGGRRCLTIRGK